MIDSILPKPRELQIGEGFYQGELQQVKQIGDDSLETEGYRLKIGAQAIEMRAKTQVGFYYAEQRSGSFNGRMAESFHCAKSWTLLCLRIAASCSTACVTFSRSPI